MGQAKAEGQGEGRLVQTSGIVYCGKAKTDSNVWDGCSDCAFQLVDRFLHRWGKGDRAFLFH
jgi:hypothetical protein